MKMRNMLAGIILCCVALSGCRTTRDILVDYEKDLSIGNYERACVEVSAKAKTAGVDQLMWQLLAGSAYYMSGRSAEAIAQFDAAEDAFEEYDKSSVFERGGEGLWAMLNNDKSLSYDGGGEDRVFTCLYKAVDYMTQGRIAAARSEFRRAALHQEDWIDERRKDIAAAEEKMEDETAAHLRQNGGNRMEQARYVNTILTDASFVAEMQKEYGYNVFSSGNLATMRRDDYVNPYLQHLTGIFRWLNSQDRGNGAAEMLRHASEIVSNSVVDADYSDCLNRRPPVNQVWIYAEDGLCPHREEFVIHLPLILIPYANRYVQYAGVAFPRLKKRAAAAQNWTVRAGHAVQPFSLLADIDKLVKTEYDVYMRGAVKRELTRAVMKVCAQIAAGIAAEKARERSRDKAARGEDNRREQTTFWILKAVQSLFAVADYATTSADIRSWTSLPKCVRVIRVERPSDGKIAVDAGAERVELIVPEGNTIVFLRKPALHAQTVVKQVTFPNS